MIELAFGDGSFVGRYCFSDFKKALQDKLENDAPARPEVKASGVPAAVPVLPK